MKSRRRNFTVEEAAENFWPSFTDLISTFVLILFILVIIAFIQNIVTGNNLEYSRKQLMDTQDRLESSRAEISQAENQLRLLEDELADTMAEIEIGQIALKLSEQEVDEQRQIIAESNRELGELRSKLQGIAVLRLDVLGKVKDSVEAALGKTNAQGQPLVTISDAGNIIINEGLVFDFNSAVVKPSGKELLNKLAEAFKSVLDDETTRLNIESIIIQGHTDERADADYNRSLSANRSGAVVNYMLSTDRELESEYGKYFASSAYSEFRPIDTGTSEEAYAKNRRIEISIVIKDSEVQNVIDEYLEETQEMIDSAEE
ncbi:MULTISPECIES: OmpA family protein [unclassified Fusibacter]|uniref:OmpA family protein n=1 Tax=unclassified Fusibacter TaxID=2624464 RepID=UPI001011E3B3|nr:MULTISPECIES: OmpA family protein [unclassified Fusibacter]MCK8061431.1 OmpA family protein [Fusibacter sp. A2]NPE23618.1 OmpA family protein [Fusibacter sp. A1]RXV58891.1 flagellar motor protein MotB [Fusibacter sp. A1]